MKLRVFKSFTLNRVFLIKVGALFTKFFWGELNHILERPYLVLSRYVPEGILVVLA